MWYAVSWISKNEKSQIYLYILVYVLLIQIQHCADWVSKHRSSLLQNLCVFFVENIEKEEPSHSHLASELLDKRIKTVEKFIEWLWAVRKCEHCKRTYSIYLILNEPFIICCCYVKRVVKSGFRWMSVIRGTAKHQKHKI